MSAAAIRYFFVHGYLQWYGDAEAHLNAARRLWDSLTPGYDQIGTPWLPVPHVAMLPFTRVDAWWHNGLAASFPAAFCFVAGGAFLFAAVRRIFDSTPAALAATALVALNPNLLYLQSTSMTEAYFFAELAAVLYFSVSGRALPAALATVLATLTRYEGWFLIPFVTAWFLFKSGADPLVGAPSGPGPPGPARRPHFTPAILYAAVAALGPLYWLAHNWYLTGDALAFYRGPYSPRAIQRGQPYPGLHDLRAAWLYYRTAIQLCAGPGLAWLGLAGTVYTLVRRAFWPLLLLALPPLFYLWSMVFSGGTPLFVPTLWPHSYYNTRYGLAALPLLAFTSSALVLFAPVRIRSLIAVLIVVGGTINWALHPTPDTWITWAESRANSTGRRAWMYAAADYLRPRYHPGAGILTSGGDDLFGIYRVSGIPLRETFSVDNGLPWDAAMQRPELYLWQEWAIARRDDVLHDALARAAQKGIVYHLEKTLENQYEPVIEIYRRTGGPLHP